MEIFLLFVSHCVPSLSIVNSFFKNTQTQFFAIFKEFAPKHTLPSKEIFLQKKIFYQFVHFDKVVFYSQVQIMVVMKKQQWFHQAVVSISTFYFLPHCNYNSIFPTFLQPICTLFSQAFCNNSCSSLFLQIPIFFDNNKLLHFHNHQERALHNISSLHESYK